MPCKASSCSLCKKLSFLCTPTGQPVRHPKCSSVLLPLDSIGLQAFPIGHSYRVLDDVFASVKLLGFPVDRPLVAQKLKLESAVMLLVRRTIPRQ